MMKSIKLMVVSLLLFVSLIFPGATRAFDIREVFTSGESIVVKIHERIEYMLAFNIEKKVEVLENQAENRLITAQKFAEDGEEKKIPTLLQNYIIIKDRQDGLLDSIDKEVMGRVEERTLGQQIIMEGIKGKVDGEMKREVIQVQEQVVNQVAQRIIEVDGKEGQTEFFNQVEHLWAPGTGPGGDASVVYEGGDRLMFAPGTSAGGSSGSDIRGIEVIGN